jgi:hypothetical protein
MESCGNYHFQIRKVAGVADGSLDSLLVNDRGIGVGIHVSCMFEKKNILNLLLKSIIPQIPVCLPMPSVQPQKKLFHFMK